MQRQDFGVGVAVDRGAAHLDMDLAAGGELDRVAHEIEQHLAKSAMLANRRSFLSEQRQLQEALELAKVKAQECDSLSSENKRLGNKLMASQRLCGELHVPREGLIRPPDSLPAYDAAGFTATARVGGPGVPLSTGPDDVVLGMGTYAFGSWHPQACMFAFADGRVVGLAADTPPDVLERWCNRHDGYVP
jgi:hypothetical protein